MRELTREEILAMEPGRELDQLVSEKIMWYQSYGDFPVHAIYNGLTATSFTIFQPSTDIKAAWEVVDKLKDYDGKHLTWHENKNEWVFGLGKGTWGRWSAWSSTPSEAICKAALLAVLEATP